MNLAQNSSKTYSWWRQALEGEFGLIYESDPQPRVKYVYISIIKKEVGQNLQYDFLKLFYL